MVFSQNQVRHLYVAGAVQNDAASLAAVKDIAVVKAKGDLYCAHKGAADVSRTDLIPVENILAVKVTEASKMAMPLKKFTIALDANVNNGAPISGQDYILRIAIRQAFGMSDEDIYLKYGAVHATANMSETAFYKQMATSLVKNFARENTKWFDFYVVKKSDNSEVEATPANLATFTEAGDSTKIKALVIKEHSQAEYWKLGVVAVESVQVNAQSFQCVPVYSAGDEVTWGTVTASTDGAVDNGKITADLEYFLMGERGDQYRNMGWPYVIKTEYLVDPSKSYDFVDIHYAYVGDNHSVQKSEKTLTIVCPSDNSHAVADALIAKLSAALPGVFKAWDSTAGEEEEGAYVDASSTVKYLNNASAASHPSYTTIG